MKQTHLPVLASFLLPLSHAAAANVTWSTAGDAATGTWNNNSFNTQAYTASDTLIIDGVTKTITIGNGVTSPTNLNVTSANAITLNGSSSIGGTLSKSGAGTLTLNSANGFGNATISGGKINLGNAGGLGTTGTLAVNDGAAKNPTGSYSGTTAANFFFDATTISSSFTFSKNISFGAVGSATTYGMAMQSPGTTGPAISTTLSGNISGGSNLTLWLDAATSGSPNYSYWVLSGDNSGFAGRIRLNRGNIRFDSAASMGTGPVYIQTNGNTGLNPGLPANLTFGFTGTSTNDITLRAGQSTDTSIDTGSNSVILSNKLTLSGSGTSPYNGTVYKIGSGTLSITGELDTRLRAGVIPTGTYPGALGTGNVSLNLNNGTFDVSGSTNTTVTFNDFSGGAGTTFDLGGKTLSASTGTFAGSITGSGGVLAKSSAGVLNLTGSNSYSGGTTITQSGLRLGHNSAAGSGNIALNYAYGTSYSSGGAAALGVSTTGLNITNNIVVSGTAGYYALQMAAGAGGSVEWSGTISGGGAGVVLQIDTPTGGDSTSTSILSGTNTFSGQIRLNRGRLVVGSSGALSTASLFMQTNANTTDGNLAFGPGVTSLSNNIVVGSLAGKTTAEYVQYINTGSADITLSGTIGSNTVTNPGQPGSLGKNGSGTLTLSGVSTGFQGDMVVSAGTLLVNGSLGTAGASATDVSVAAAATVGGTGTVSGNLTLDATSLFRVVDINDPLTVSGTVTLGTGFGIANLGNVDWDSLALDTEYTLIDGTGTVFSAENIANFGIANAVSVGGSGRMAYFDNGSLALFVTVPEPSSMVLGGLGALALLRRRRR